MSKQDEKQEVSVAELREAVASVWPLADITDKKTYDKATCLWLLEVAELFPHGKEKMAEILRRYREKYEDSTTPNGRKSKRCGDELSVFLTGLDHRQVALLAAVALGLDDQWELWKKYEHLNNGQIRMNSSNRLRGAIKRGELIVEDIRNAFEKNRKAISEAVMEVAA